MKPVLALKADGTISYCKCPPELRGKGRCDHVAHQEIGEGESDFMDRVSPKEEVTSYHMSDEEKIDYMEIKGRKDLADEECEGGYIELDTPVWSPSNIKEFSEISGTSGAIINGVISERYYLDADEMKFKKLSNAKEFSEMKKENPGRYLTGIEALNEYAQGYGYEATTSVYVLPYYMRQNTGDIQNPINTLYNALIVTDNARTNFESQAEGKKLREVSANKVQECYERLLNNKGVKKHGFKPLTSHGGFAVDSLSDLVNGKSGIMRGYITGFSIPYSGRAVISPNIKIEYGEVGIPSKMAAKIFSPTITSELQKEGYSPKDCHDFISRVSAGEGSHDDVEKLDRLLSNNDCKVLVNRQPSLHMSSMVCFKSRLTEVVDGSLRSSSNIAAKDIIQLNPMLAKGFNADFDGDTQAVYALNDKNISSDAWAEMSPFTEFVSHNPKNLGESMTTPTKDCLFGLMSILG